MRKGSTIKVHLVNPSDNSFGTAVITPRWLFVLAAATPSIAGDPILVDESLEQIVPESISPGDIVGISVHTGNALRGYEVGRMARARAHGSFTAEFMRRSSPRSPLNAAKLTLLSKATVTSSGPRSSPIVSQASPAQSTMAAVLKAASSFRRDGI